MTTSSRRHWFPGKAWVLGRVWDPGWVKRQEFWCWAPLCHSDAEPGNAEFCLSAHRMERLGSRASYGKRHNLRGKLVKHKANAKRNLPRKVRRHFILVSHIQKLFTVNKSSCINLLLNIPNTTIVNTANENIATLVFPGMTKY